MRTKISALFVVAVFATSLIINMCHSDDNVIREILKKAEGQYSVERESNLFRQKTLDCVVSLKVTDRCLILVDSSSATEIDEIAFSDITNAEAEGYLSFRHYFGSDSKASTIKVFHDGKIEGQTMGLGRIGTITFRKKA